MKSFASLLTAALLLLIGAVAADAQMIPPPYGDAQYLGTFHISTVIGPDGPSFSDGSSGAGMEGETVAWLVAGGTKTVWTIDPGTLRFTSGCSAVQNMTNAQIFDAMGRATAKFAVQNGYNQYGQQISVYTAPCVSRIADGFGCFTFSKCDPTNPLCERGYRVNPDGSVQLMFRNCTATCDGGACQSTCFGDAANSQDSYVRPAGSFNGRESRDGQWVAASNHVA